MVDRHTGFASYGTNYGKEGDLPTPSFIKISGHIYSSSRLLNAEDGLVVGLNPIVGRGKDTSPNIDKYSQFESLKRAKILKQNLDPPPVSKVTKAGNWEKLTIEATQGWTIDPFVEGQEVLIVGHIEPTFAPNYCSPELRLDHVYMLPIEPVAFEWPEPVTSASTSSSAATTPPASNPPNKKPKIELLPDF